MAKRSCEDPHCRELSLEIEQLAVEKLSVAELIEKYDNTLCGCADTIAMCQKEGLTYRATTLYDTYFTSHRGSPTLRDCSLFDYIPWRTKLIGIYIDSPDIYFSKYSVFREDDTFRRSTGKVFVQYNTDKPEKCWGRALFTTKEHLEPTRVVFIYQEKPYKPPVRQYNRTLSEWM